MKNLKHKIIIYDFSFLICFLIINLPIIQAQEVLSDTSIYIKKADYQGVIFNSKADNNPDISAEEVAIAEEALGWFMEKQRRKKSLVNQGGSCPYIHRKLRKYKRQYIGKLDEKGRKILVIRAFLEFEKYFFPTWKSQMVQELGGCSHFWSIKVNLKKQKCFDYQINN